MYRLLFCFTGTDDDVFVRLNYFDVAEYKKGTALYMDMYGIRYGSIEMEFLLILSS